MESTNLVYFVVDKKFDSKMQNVHSAGRVPYEAAPPLKHLTVSEKIQFVIELIFDIVKVLILCLPIFCRSLRDKVIPPNKKNIGGQIALVTGGGNGIGRAIALRLAKEGCSVVIADIDGEAAKNTAEDVQRFSVNGIGYEIDVSDNDKLKQLKVDIENDLGPVDILVNNAGLMPLLSLREGNIEDINRITAVNINAYFWTTRTFLEGMMKRRRGHILSISSMSAFHPMGGAIVYTATKFAVAGYMQAMEQELRQEGFSDCIHYTCVHPYFVSTRKDLMEVVNLRFAPITAEQTADVAVDALLRNERIVAVPRIDRFFTNFIKLFPYEGQCLIRDHILKEKDSKMFQAKDIVVNNDLDLLNCF